MLCDFILYLPFVKDKIMEELINKSKQKIETVSLSFKRFLFDEINWKRKLIGIKGGRGTGKTTLLLQYIKAHIGISDEVLYVSLDDLYFSENKLTELADNFVKLGGKYLFLDEIHKYPEWSRELKNMYDDFNDLKIVFTGSSILEIDKGEADLSRRAVIYELPVLSLREYIALKNGIIFNSYSLPEILEEHSNIEPEINSRVKPLKEYNSYTIAGAYPFFMETEGEYPEHLARIINLILETDLPASVSVEYSSVLKLKQLLWVISESVPFQPNISKLSLKTGVTRDTLIKYLSLLEKAQLISLLRTNSKGISKMAKPDKIYFNNTNLLNALQPGKASTGTIRESFFLNQVSAKYVVSYPKKGDFIADNRYLFEVGGKNKTSKQLSGIPESYIAADNIEYGFKNKIPLWLLGFLY